MKSIVTDPAFIALTVGYSCMVVAFVFLLARNTHREAPNPATRVTVTTDSPLQPEDLQAIGHLLAAHFDDPEAVYDAIVAQVAKDEAAAGLDEALERITEDGAA